MGCHCHDDDPRRRRVLRQLARAQASGALAGVAGGGLGALEAGAWFPTPAEIDAETEAFDGRLNAWLFDYQTQIGRLPKALVQQVDNFVERWRDLRASFYLPFLGFTKTRGDAILGMQAEWNRLRDQVAGYGAESAIAPSMVTVDGREVRADQIPPGQSTFDRIESLAKWGAVIVGGAAAFKIASDLGAFKKIGGLIGARGR
jgi:hypothetical protein